MLLLFYIMYCARMSFLYVQTSQYMISSYLSLFLDSYGRLVFLNILFQIQSNTSRWGFKNTRKRSRTYLCYFGGLMVIIHQHAKSIYTNKCSQDHYEDLTFYFGGLMFIIHQHAKGIHTNKCYQYHYEVI